jgi:hypothetical protein
MRTKKILYAGQAGTQKWVKEYGEKLIAVRYKYDATIDQKMITVELVADIQDWKKNDQRIPHNKKVRLKIMYGEMDLGIKIRSAGGIWNRKDGVWECRYGAVKALGLTDRIVENKNKRV